MEHGLRAEGAGSGTGEEFAERGGAEIAVRVRMILIVTTRQDISVGGNHYPTPDTETSLAKGFAGLKIAKDRDDIQAVIAYSPGEFFGELNIGRYITGLTTPTYIGCPRSEYSYVSQLAAGIEAPKTVVFQPENADGQHGAKTLWWESDTCEEFWLSLLFFLKDFK